MDDQAHFMAGIALMDEMLREAERQGGEDPQHFWMEANIRRGRLNFYLRPLLAQLLARPELLDGFSAALGDYLGELAAGLVPASGDAYTHLTYDDIMRVDPQDAAPPASNVVPLRASAPTARGGA